MRILKVFIGSSDEYLMVFDLCAMGLAWLEIPLASEVNISEEQYPLVDVVVQRIDRNTQFRMAGDKHIWVSP